MRREKTLKVCANHFCKCCICCFLPSYVDFSLFSKLNFKLCVVSQISFSLCRSSFRSFLVYLCLPCDNFNTFVSACYFFVNLFAVTKDMELKPNCGSERAWVWTVAADYADEEPQKETLAIRFANAES